MTRLIVVCPLFTLQVADIGRDLFQVVRDRGGSLPGELQIVCLRPRSVGMTDNPQGDVVVGSQNAGDPVKELARVGAGGGSVLMNSGPRPDGSLEPLDEQPLREVGARILRQGGNAVDAAIAVQFAISVTNATFSRAVRLGIRL